MNAHCGGGAGPDRDVRFWRELSRTVQAQRIPFSGSLALTHHCNLACVHCYAREGKDHPPEPPTRRWLEIMDEIRDAGCLYLLLTGGEPLFRGDFSRIYTHAKRSGFLTTVFTNATLVDAKILDLFTDLPPYLVEVSLYGASPRVHDRITGVPGSFERARRGIDALLERGINLRLKSVLMTLNFDDFPALEALSRRLGVKFRFDPALFPLFSGDKTPLDLRVEPRRAVEREMSDPARREEWLGFLAQFDGPVGDDGLYNCGSGVNTFHVDAAGWLYPCLMVRDPRYSLVSGSFRKGWAGAFNDFRRSEPPRDMPCRDCDRKLLCGYCPGFFAMETDSEYTPSKYICDIGTYRYRELLAGRLEVG